MAGVEAISAAASAAGSLSRPASRGLSATVPPYGQREVPAHDMADGATASDVTDLSENEYSGIVLCMDKFQHHFITFVCTVPFCSKT